MKLIFLINLIFLVACTRGKPKKNCDLENNPCPGQNICTLSLGEGICQSLLLEEKPFKGVLPFDGIQPIRCKAGLNSSKREFLRDTDSFALLFTGLGELSALRVRAMAKGVAHIYDECPNRENTNKFTHQTTCGLGLGNHVRILHPDGYLSVYAHLSEISVKTGDIVEQGQEIGIEGASGNTSQRGVRVSVHRPWSPQMLLSQPGQVGRSLGFLLLYREANENVPEWKPSINVQCGEGIGVPFIYGSKK